MRSMLIRSTLALATVALGACTALAPGGLPAGTSIGEARASFLGPTGEYPLPGGGTRLEFARGAHGKQTYMLDFDASGRLVASQQVLTERNFATIVPGLPAGEVRMRLGRPRSSTFRGSACRSGTTATSRGIASGTRSRSATSIA